MCCSKVGIGAYTKTKSVWANVFFAAYVLLRHACPTFLLVRTTFTVKKLLRNIFTEEKLFRATCSFTKIKLQIIASLSYKIGAHFGQYFRDLSPKVGEDQNKNKKGLRHKSELILGKPNRRFWFRPSCY